MRPRTLHEAAARIASDGEWDHHVREFLDVFYARDGDRVRQAAMIEDEPAILSLGPADAYLGAVAEHLARRWGLVPPGWVRDDRRYLARPLFLPRDPHLRSYLMIVSPVAFRARLIFTGPEPLRRKGFPAHGGGVSFAPIGNGLERATGDASLPG